MPFLDLIKFNTGAFALALNLPIDIVEPELSVPLICNFAVVMPVTAAVVPTNKRPEPSTATLNAESVWS